MASAVEGRPERRVVAAQVLGQRVGHDFVHVDARSAVAGAPPAPAIEADLHDSDGRHQDQRHDVGGDDRRPRGSAARRRATGPAPTEIHAQHGERQIVPALAAHLDQLRQKRQRRMQRAAQGRRSGSKSRADIICSGMRDPYPVAAQDPGPAFRSSRVYIIPSNETFGAI